MLRACPSVVSLVPAPLLAHQGHSWPFVGTTPTYSQLTPNDASITCRLELDLDVHAGRQIQARQRLDRLGRWLDDVDQPLVRANLKLFPRVLVDERAAIHRILGDMRRQ